MPAPRAAAFAALTALTVIVVVRLRRKGVDRARRRAKAQFLARAGQRYGYASSPAGHIDSWRSKELPGLVGPLERDADGAGERIVYLDYAGAALPVASQLAALASDGTRRVLANPHSTGPAASAASAELDRARALVLAHFCGSAAPDWECIWTSGATAALRLVAETFPFSQGSALLMPESCHTSVLGMRGPAGARGARCFCAKDADTHVRLAAEVSAAIAATGLRGASAGGCAPHGSTPPPAIHGSATDAATVHSLSVVTPECNLTGDKTDVAARVLTRLGASQGASGGGTTGPQDGRAAPASRWWVMLDGAKAATGELHLPSTGAAFCCVSFYKLFGAPTGLGALLVRRDALRLLRKDGDRGYFGGGSVAAALPHAIGAGPESQQLGVACGDDLGPDGTGVGDRGSSRRFFNPPKSQVSEALTDGTAHFLGASALARGFDELRRLGGAAAVAAHAGVLAEELHARLVALRHADGTPAVEVYGSGWACLGMDRHGKAVVKPTSADPLAAGIRADLAQPDQVADRAAAGGEPACEHAAAMGCDRATCPEVIAVPMSRSGAVGTGGAAVAAHGPTVAFNVLRHDGSYVGYAEVGKLAALHRPPIQLRTGCCCNPGGCQALLKMSEADVLRAVAAGKQCGDQFDLIDGRPTGLVRASLGKDSIWEDVEHLVAFIERTFVLGPAERAARTATAARGLGAERAPNTAVRASQAACALFGGGTALSQGGAAPAVGRVEQRPEFRLSAIYVHPIKSCGGMRVRRWPVDRQTGRLLCDREWGIAGPSGVLLRSTSQPRLALLRPTLDLEAGTLTLSAPGMADLAIPVRRRGLRAPRAPGERTAQSWVADSSVAKGCGDEASESTATTSDDQATMAHCRAPYAGVAPRGRVEAVTGDTNEEPLSLCGEECYGWAVGGAAVADWLEQAVGVPCRLVRCARAREGVRGESSPADVSSAGSSSGGDGGGGRNGGGGGGSIGFANEAPLLLVSQSAVETLNGELRRAGERAVSAACFRPNLVVESPSRYSAGVLAPLHPGRGPEDEWSALRIFSHGAMDGVLPQPAEPALRPDGTSLLPQQGMAGAAHGTGSSCGVWPLPVGTGCSPTLDLRVVGPCARCAMVELDPSSGARHGSVLRTLASYRRSHARIDFGVFCEVAARRQGGAGGEAAPELGASADGQGGERDESLFYVEEGALVEPFAPKPLG